MSPAIRLPATEVSAWDCSGKGAGEGPARHWRLPGKGVAMLEMKPFTQGVRSERS